MNKTILKKYARLVVRMGVNIKKGQGALIMAETDQAEFALMVAEEAYKAGAKWVDMRWTNQSFTKLQLRKESLQNALAHAGVGEGAPAAAGRGPAGAHLDRFGGSGRA